ncbi:MAG: type VI secretion system protein TssA [Pyrinomonadaceae bacterium]|nr:type VI secretion system protein TssA [Pyrinomonadaceae bacterium]
MEIVSTPQVIDLEVFLAPIAGENPSGASLKYAGTYDEIKEARRADDSMAQGSWQRELKIPDWRRVIELSTTVLTTQTKDLQIAVWFVEALIKQHGFAGLRDGLKLVRGFHENFWETFYPENDEGDLEGRANALESMDKQSAFALKEVALTIEGLSFNKFDESKSFDIPENMDALEYSQQERFRALQEQATEERRTTGDMWRKAKAATPRVFYEQVFFTLEEIVAEFTILDRTIDEKFGNQTPGLGALKKSIDDVRDAVKKITIEKREAEPDEVTPEILSENGSSGDGQMNGSSSASSSGQNFAQTMGGAIRSRNDALKKLSEVADFFKQTEPHSPVSYLVSRAVRFGNMPLESVLHELIKDETVLSNIKETLGILSSEE